MPVLHVVYFEPQVNSSTIQDFHFPSEHSRPENQGKKSRTFHEAWEHCLLSGIVPAALLQAGVAQPTAESNQRKQR